MTDAYAAAAEQLGTSLHCHAGRPAATDWRERPQRLLVLGNLPATAGELRALSFNVMLHGFHCPFTVLSLSFHCLFTVFLLPFHCGKARGVPHHAGSCGMLQHAQHLSSPH